MSRIIRTDANPVLAKAVEYHGFVYTQGVVAADPDQDITDTDQGCTGADRRIAGNSRYG